MRLHQTLICLCLLTLFTLPAGAQDMKLQPVDEGAKDASWVSFKNRLLDALDKKDRKLVLGIIDKNIRNSFDGTRGISEFKKLWDFDAEDSPLWLELKAALFLGGAYRKRDKAPDEFCAPYVLPKWPDNIDPHTHGAIIARDVLVKSEPSSASATLQTLAYDIVAVTDWDVADQVADVKQRWVKVKIKEGEGFVPEEQIRSPIEHTACFVKEPNGWRLIAMGVGGI
ncbi:MAG: hypothetical protein Q8K18_04030 [Burkholderiales bacterium]|nr:hypothetical protein [Burkholderiales bacterium]